MLEVIRPIVAGAQLSDQLKTAVASDDDWLLGKGWWQYVTCFSPQNDLPGQWEKYADQGRGFAIALSYPELSAAADGNYALARVEYSRVKQERAVESTIEGYHQSLRKFGIDEGDGTHQFDLLDALLVNGFRFKRPADHEENEWRLLMARPTESPERHLSGAEEIGHCLVSIAGITQHILLGPNCTESVEDIKNELRGTKFASVPVIT